jgi:glyoxylase-like metal-dependent hydrolase (beta-lactamase superfamily II)
MTTLAAASSFIFKSSSLLSWNAYDTTVKADLTSNAVLTKDGWWLIDPIELPEEYAVQFDRKPVLGILLTNENHERETRILAKELGAKIYAHKETTAHLTLPPNEVLKDNQSIPHGPKVYFIPGPSYGETAYFFAEQKILAVGDAFINLPETGFTFLPDKYCQDQALAKTNPKVVADLDFDILTFAHGGPLIDAKPKFLSLIKTI